MPEINWNELEAIRRLQHVEAEVVAMTMPTYLPVKFKNSIFRAAILEVKREEQKRKKQK